MTELRLPPAAHSVARARRFVRDQLATSRVDVDTALLLVSEVVTNAVLHARSELLVQISQRDEHVRVEVRDGSPSGPRLRRFAVDSATGRGVRLLDRLSAAWGCEPDGAGKVVWFEVGVPDEAAWSSFGDTQLAEPAYDL